MREHKSAGRVAKPDSGREVGTVGLDRSADVNADPAAPRQPLIATQNRSRAADGDGNDRNAA
jgi:hypothetical protein